MVSLINLPKDFSVVKKEDGLVKSAWLFENIWLKVNECPE
jgi:hypothetical protein